MKKEERKASLLPDGKPKYIRCYDNGGKTFDRYTVVYTGKYKGKNECMYIGMSAKPFDAMGFGQHGFSKDSIDRPTYSHLGKKIKFDDLPDDCRKLVLQDYTELWNL